MARVVDGLSRALWSTLLTIAICAVVGVGLGYALELTLAGSMGLYFVVWWTVLFMILPIQIRSQAEAGAIVEGTDPGAPASPALRERAIWTSAVATILFTALAAVFPLAGL